MAHGNFVLFFMCLFFPFLYMLRSNISHGDRTVSAAAPLSQPNHPFLQVFSVLSLATALLRIEEYKLDIGNAGPTLNCPRNEYNLPVDLRPRWWNDKEKGLACPLLQVRLEGETG